MIKINEIPEDYEPRNKILPKLPEYITPQGYREPEMTDSQSAFLCGLLKNHHPKKILEVGVAGGATTAIILQALEDIGEPYEMHSVDLNTQFYRDKTKPSGFMAAFAKENNLFTPPPTASLNGKHEFQLGRYLPQVIDEIGGDIDFVILDTVHSMPGEGLDFLAMLPYLKVGAIVVLHDVALNQYERPQCTNAFATGVLFSAVTAEKFLNFLPNVNGNTFFRYPNISAFQVNEQTRANVDQVFLSLLITWSYIPQPSELQIYRAHYQRHYPKEMVDIFVETIKMNLCNMVMASYV